MPQYAGYINNEFTAGRGERLTVENPSDESELASFRGLCLAQIETRSSLPAVPSIEASGAIDQRMNES